MLDSQLSGSNNRYWFVMPVEQNGSEHPYVEISDSIYLLSRLAIGLYVVFIVVVAFMSPIPNGQYVARLITSIAALLLTTLPLWWRIKEVGLFHPLYLISAMMFLRGALTGVTHNAYGIGFHPAVSNITGGSLEVLQMKVTLLEMLATACTYAVFFYSGGLRWNFLAFKNKKGVLFFGSIVGLTVGSICLYWLTEASGGLSEHLKNINVGVRAKIWVKDVEYISIYAQLIRLTILAPTAWILAGKRPFANPLFWILAIFAIAAAFMTSGRRSTIAMTALVFVACWILRRGSLAIGRLAIIGLLLFLMIGIVGEFRRSNWGRSRDVNFEAVFQQNFDTAMRASYSELSARQNASPIYPIVAYVPDRVPFRYGSIYLSYLYRFIPRSIWKDKPEGGIGHDCAQIFYGRGKGVGVPPGAVGEAYWSLGFMGIALVFSFWGWCLRSIANFYEQFRGSVFASIIYLTTIVILRPSETGFRSWLYLIVPLVGMLFLVGAVRLTGARDR